MHDNPRTIIYKARDKRQAAKWLKNVSIINYRCRSTVGLPVLATTKWRNMSANIISIIIIMEMGIIVSDGCSSWHRAFTWLTCCVVSEESAVSRGLNSAMQDSSH